MTKEQKFYKALQDVFIGARIEGTGGFVNLMKIKSNYYRKIEELLKKDIEEEALKKYPSFRDELFDKLYSFFSRYFTESGSIYFNSTPFHNNIYEKVYTDDKDVILFWKTQMLYYVKTDRIFRSLEIESDGYKFFFDVSSLEHKKANEKRSLIYELKEVKEDKTIVFDVYYSEKGRVTKTEDILKELKTKHISITEEELERTFRVFEKQSEVDFFINKNAKAFLQEQFKLWSYQYFWEGAKEWTADRVNQLQILKDIAFKIIDFISQFEDELVKIWNKPKFVRKSNYVIALDRIWSNSPSKNGCQKFPSERGVDAESGRGVFDEMIHTSPDTPLREGNETPRQVSPDTPLREGNGTPRQASPDTPLQEGNLVWRILNHSGIKEQIKEWKELGIVDENFRVEDIIENDLTGKHLSEKYKHLPIDTKYFKDLELEILQLFDDLDEALDGWLIKSENYQALNTILPKFKQKVQTIYIDPPFNLDSSDQFLYRTNYKDANWATLLENRLRIAKKLLNEKGSIFVRCDYNGNWIVRCLMDEIFGNDNLRNELIVNRISKKGFANREFFQPIKYPEGNDYLFFYANSKDSYFNFVKIEVKKVVKEKWHSMDVMDVNPKPRPRIILGKEMFAPPGRKWMFSQEKIDEMEKEGLIRLNSKGIPQYKVKNQEFELLDSKWVDIPGYSSNTEFATENSEKLLSRVINTTSKRSDLIFDFFLGSGTTTAVAHKLGRKWIGVEMGEHFYSVVLPRMKKVLFYDKSGISKEVKEYQGGGFFKYYELEQYEETLTNCVYEDSDLFTSNDKSPYEQYVFLKDEKMLKALEIDYEGNKVRVDLTKLYPDIDIAETLSNLTGKWIKKVTPRQASPATPLQEGNYPHSQKEYQKFPSERGVDAESGRGVFNTEIKWHELPFNPELKEKAKALRKAGNLSEVLFWNRVKDKQFLGLDFDRQKIIGNYIVDFYCKNLGVVIEIDGESHNDKEKYDLAREEYLKGLGLKVIHISDISIKKNLDGVMEFLKDELNTLSLRDTSLVEGNETPRQASPDTPLREGNYPHSQKEYQESPSERGVDAESGRGVFNGVVYEVEFEDGTVVNTQDLDYKIIKPLIWWE